ALEEESAEALEGRLDRPVLLQRAVGPVGLPRVLEPEALGLLEVELDRRALPLPPDGIVELDVDLRSIERAASLVDAVRGAAVLERLLERALRLIPRRVGAELLVGPGGQIEPVAEPEGLAEHQLHDVQQLADRALARVGPPEGGRAVHRPTS